VGYELIQRTVNRVLLVPAFKLIQRLLEAKRELNSKSCSRNSMATRRSSSTIWDTCSKPARKWKCFYFLAERYDAARGDDQLQAWSSSKWERIFQDPMTAMAAVDRLVHHSVIWSSAAEPARA